MYTWVIDYVYTFIILLWILSSPLIAYFIDKKIFKNIAKFRIIVISFISSLIIIVLLLILKQYHIDTILNICYDMPIIVFKNDDIPLDCYNFQPQKYMGVGWPITAFFLLILTFIYLIFIYIIWKTYERIKLHPRG